MPHAAARESRSHIARMAPHSPLSICIVQCPLLSALRDCSITRKGNTRAMRRQAQQTGQNTTRTAGEQQTMRLASMDVNVPRSAWRGEIDWNGLDWKVNALSSSFLGLFAHAPLSFCMILCFSLSSCVISLSGCLSPLICCSERVGTHSCCRAALRRSAVL